MKFGVFLPISGRATGPDTLREAARSAEALGFDAVWAADRVVTPWQINTSYPYSENHEFIVPPDRPFLDSFTCLALLDTRSRLYRAAGKRSPDHGSWHRVDGGGVRGSRRSV